MKKALFTLAALLCASGIFFACSKASQNQNQEQKKEEETIKSEAFAKLGLKTTPDFLKYFDITVEYYDLSTGEKKSTKLTESFYHEGHPALPCKLGMKVTTTVKDGVSLETIEVPATFDYVRPVILRSFVLSYGNRVDALHAKWDEPSVSQVTGSDNVQKMLNKFFGEVNDGKWNKSVLFTYDAEGAETEGTWE